MLNTVWSPARGYTRQENKSMNATKIFPIILFFLLGTFTGCGRKDNTPAGEKMTVTDMAGRTVVVPREVDRTVCLGPGTLRLIVYLDAADKIAGIEGGFETKSPAGRPYMIAHPEFTELPVIGAAAPSPQLNPEAIISVKPDVIFIAYVEPKTADGLQNKTGVPVVVLSYGDMEIFDNQYISDSLELGGKILDKKKRAEEVVNFIKDLQKDIQMRALKEPALEKPKIYVGGLGFRGARGLASTNSRYPAFELLKANNVAGQLDKIGQVFVDKEKIIDWDPDIIFIDAAGLEIVRDDYRKNPRFYSLLKAVRNEKLYGLFPYNYYTTNLDTALADAYFIGKVLYPEGFRDIVPEEKADDIYRFLVGKPVYEEMAQDWEGFKKVKLSGRQ